MKVPTKYSGLSTIVENRTKVLVPSRSLQSGVATKREPVFFNFAAEFNRDISVVAYRSFLSYLYSGYNRAKNKCKSSRGNVTLADSLCASGVRGLRVAVEVPQVNQVYFNDVNPVAIDVAKRSAVINHVEDKCHFSVNEVCKFLLGTVLGRKSNASPSDKYGEEELGILGRRFTIVDLDPFGSPANYVDCVMRSVEDGGLISITATDTAVLFGKYPDVCLRKYYGLPLKNSYSNETALRLLISLVALTSSRLGIHIRPLFAHTNMHYLRMYAKVSLSSKLANRISENIGYLQHCFHCGNRTVSDFQSRTEMCDLCASKFKIAGWLWTGTIYEKEFVRDMITNCYLHNEVNCQAGSAATHDTVKDNSPKHGNCCENKKLAIMENAIKGREKRLHRLFSRCMAEYDEIPYYFTSDEIASKLKIGPPSLTTIIEILSHAGFKTSRSGLNPVAFKTEAKMKEILNLLQP